MSIPGTVRFSGISPRKPILTDQQAGDESSDGQNNGSGVGGIGAVPDSIRSMSPENSSKGTQEVVADMVSSGLGWLSSKLAALFDDSEDDASVATQKEHDVSSAGVDEDLGAPFGRNTSVNGKSVDDDEALRSPEHLPPVSLADELAEVSARMSGAGDDIEVKEEDVKTPPVTPPVTPSVTPINLP